MKTMSRLILWTNNRNPLQTEMNQDGRAKSLKVAIEVIIFLSLSLAACRPYSPFHSVHGNLIFKKVVEPWKKEIKHLSTLCAGNP